MEIKIKSGKKSIVAKLTEKTNKKGVIRGNNKKETKSLRAMCVHHRINKKGKIKPTISAAGDRCECKMCGNKFPTKILKQDRLMEIYSPLKGYVNQAKFMAVAGDLGDEVTNFLCKFSVDLEKFPKVYRKIASAVEKKDSVKKKRHNKHGNNNSGSSSYGSWG